MTLKQDYPNEDNPEAKVYKDYKAWGMLDELERMKPEPLDDRQDSLLQLFYKCRQYSKPMETIPIEIAERFSNNCEFESDLAMFIINKLDSEYLKICYEKEQRDIENIKNNGKHK